VGRGREGEGMDDPPHFELATGLEANRKSYVACRMAPVLVTLNHLEGHCRPFQLQC